MNSSLLIHFALLILPAYLLGSIPFGLFMGKINGIDIRDFGSGNIGATNVWRTLGKKWGLLTFVLDSAKGFAAVSLARAIADYSTRGSLIVPDDYLAYAESFAGIACILGHSFPLWLKFKGGKGVATSLGVILGIMPPVATAVVFCVWGLVFGLSRYVSLASIFAALALPLTLVVLYQQQLMNSPVTLGFGCAAAFLVIRRHRENIRRLVAGTENRFGKKKDSGAHEN